MVVGGTVVPYADGIEVVQQRLRGCSVHLTERIGNNGILSSQRTVLKLLLNQFVGRCPLAADEFKRAADQNVLIDWRCITRLIVAPIADLIVAIV